MKRFVSWSELDAIGSSLTDQLAEHEPDLIVGIARGGLPLAVLLSHRTGCRSFGSVLAQKTDSEEAFAVSPTGQVELGDAMLPPVAPRRVALVDDVVAHGDVFAVVAESLAQRWPERPEIIFATAFLDRASVRRGPYADVLDRCVFGEDIDNQRVWVVFPWEQDDDRD